MNERITELAKQAITFRIDPDSNCYEALICPEDLELFAELIVRECKRAIDPTGDLTSMAESGWRNACMKMIDEHFGVEE